MPSRNFTNNVSYPLRGRVTDITPPEQGGLRSRSSAAGSPRAEGCFALRSHRDRVEDRIPYTRASELTASCARPADDRRPSTSGWYCAGLQAPQSDQLL